MKKTIILIAAMVALAACQKEDCKPPKSQQCANADSLQQILKDRLIMR